MYTQDDLSQIANKGMTVSQVQRQIDHFVTGFPFVRLERPATPGDGIVTDRTEFRDSCRAYYDKRPQDLHVLKFVPASGAASRMFKHLFEFREQYRPGSDGDILFTKDQGFNSVFHLITNLSKTAFFGELSEKAAAKGRNINDLLNAKSYDEILSLILDPEGLDYARLPKALISFHQYPKGPRKAVEEHLVEAAEYARDGNGIARLHFTISPEHREKFVNLLVTVQRRHESELGVKFDISFSVQKSSTDTIAVDENNRPVRNADGSLLFRPGGHGALLENLNDQDADIVFIKNIDNIVPDRIKSPTCHYKEVIGGYLLMLKEKIDYYLGRLESGPITEAAMEEMILFASDKLCLDVAAIRKSRTVAEIREKLSGLLHRPVRVCGMVRNSGEPGGGPYWVREIDGTLTLQIVETSQVDLNDPAQVAILAGATHFNPVDLVCSLKDHHGRKYDLREFVDENTGFISMKSSGGKTVKAQELPGLWNGSMARWITVFVEVPIITFNPVKTVNDLLRGEHLTS